MVRSDENFLGIRVALRWAAGLLLLAGATLSAQSYQSSFSGATYDRVKSPRVLKGVVDVDTATGAVSVDMPLGPGIGARGAMFRPVMRGRHSSFRVQTANTSTIQEYASGGFSIAPGVMQFSGCYLLGSYTGPQGESERFGQPGSRTQDVSNPQVVLSAFGLGDESVAQLPRMSSTFDGSQNFPANQPNPGLCVTDSGALIIPMRDATTYPILTVVSPVDGSTIQNSYEIPQRVLVVKGDYAYEYAYVNHSWSKGEDIGNGLWGGGYRENSAGDSYSPLGLDGNSMIVNELLVTSGSPVCQYNRPADANPAYAYASAQSLIVLDQIDYVLIKIRNRFQESIRFDYGTNSNGVDYVAEWYRGETPTGVKIRQQYVTSTSGGQYGGFQVRLSYEGISHTNYLISSDVGNVWAVLRTSTWWNARGSYVAGCKNCTKNGIGGLIDPMNMGYITKVTPEDSPSESVTFNWERIGSDSYHVGSRLASVFSPGREIHLSWEPYEYRENLVGIICAGFYSVAGGDRNWAFGVVRIGDKDTLTGQTRSTQFVRNIPVPDLSATNAWTAKDATTTVIHPDGSISFFRYMSAPDYNPAQEGSLLGGVHSTNLQHIKTAAFLKSCLIEERHYDAAADWASDIAAAPDQSQAHKVVLYDHFTLRCPANPTGARWITSHPIPTRTRTLDLLNKTMTQSESVSWEAAERGWLQNQQLTYGALTSVTTPADSDVLSLADQGASPSDVTPTVSRKSDLHHKSDASLWLLGQNTEVTSSTLTDSTGRMIGAVGPFSKEVKVFDSLNRVTEVQSGVSSQLKVSFQYPASSGPETALPQSASLLGPFQQSGAIGASYEYDTYGFANTIHPSPSSPNQVVKQTSDAANRPVSQSGMDGLPTSIAWDSLGRLNAVTPPGGDFATTYAPDSDGLGVTITRGSERSQLRYNAFGELVLERRFDASNNPSNRTFGYDLAGRKIWETTWRPGPGDEHAWKLPLAPEDQTTAAWTEVTDECLSWATGYVDGVWSKFCSKYRTIEHPASSVFVNSIHYDYDPQGRVTLVVDPNGYAVQTNYGVRSRTVTVGLQWNGTKPVATPSTARTIYELDAEGRVGKVIDALNHVTEYFYDHASRIAEVRQYPSSNASGATWVGTGTPQVRSWAYNAMGWPVVLDQPESGVTYYSSFTVQGKPMETVYGLPRGWRPADVNGRDSGAFSNSNARAVNTLYDDLGRPTRVWSNDGSVDQTMVFGRPGSVSSQNVGKLVQASTAQGVLRTLDYDPGTGRLSTLTRGLAGQTFLQRIGYDAYGRVIARTYPDGKVQNIQYDNALGLPKTMDFGGSSQVSLQYDPLWLLQSMAYNNGPTSAYTYSPDQVRLATMSHSLSGKLAKTWKYNYNEAGQLGTDGENWYSYDPLGRLTQAFVRDLSGIEKQGVQQQFGFDAFGNRISSNAVFVTNWDPGATPPASPDPMVTPSSFPAINVAFNASDTALQNRLPAFMANGAATGAQYDAQGNLTQVNTQPGSSAPWVKFTYDALGRVTSQYDSQRGITERYYHDDEGLRTVIEEWSGTLLTKVRIKLYNDSRQLVSEYESVLGLN